MTVPLMLKVFKGAELVATRQYERDIIKKHERTRKDKEDDRTRHIIDLRAQTGPVFLTYPTSDAVDAVAARVAGRYSLVISSRPAASLARSRP